MCYFGTLGWLSNDTCQPWRGLTEVRGFKPLQNTNEYDMRTHIWGIKIHVDIYYIGSTTFRGIFFHFFGEFFSILSFRSFWKFFMWKVSEASRETILLEAFSVKIVGSIARNARFGSLFCEISRTPRTKRSFWKLLLWNFEETSRETLVLEPSFVKFRRNDHFGTFFCQNCRRLRTKRSFGKLFLWNFEEASRETPALEPSVVKFRWSLARNDHSVKIVGNFAVQSSTK